MPNFRTATVTRVLTERDGLCRVEVMVDSPPAEPTLARAYAIEQLCGPITAGNRVVLNTTAVDLGLGTGGWHVVHWNLDRSDYLNPGPEHIMKLRYTSLQSDVGAAELEWGDAADAPITGVPVIATGLHSLAGVVLSAARQLAPEAKLAYVMTDGAALPYALSDLMHRLTGEGIVDHTLSAGHAFGAEVETVTVASALGIAANELGADLIIVAMGPGVVGTGSRLGTTAIEVAHVLADVSLAAGLPILAPRVSGADPRARHQGISHHTVTAAHRSRTRPLCPDLSDLGVDMTNLSPHVDLATVAVASAPELLGADGGGIRSMGRGIAEDPLFFESGVRAAALGVRAADRRRADLSC
jgi:hypothetical protein